MKKLNKIAWGLPLVVLVMSQGTTFAAVQTYTTEASFISAINSSYKETFTTLIDAGEPISFSGGAPITYTIGSQSGNGVTPFDVGGISGARAIGPYDANDVLVITFTGTKPTAIGGDFFWTGGVNNSLTAGSVKVQYGGVSDFIEVPLPSAGSFAGITTDGVGFSSVSVSLIAYTAGDFRPTLDNFYVGQVNPVPEPGTWLAGGFIALVMVSRTGIRLVKRKLVPQSR